MPVSVRTPRDRATPDTAALGVAGERTGANAKLDGRGAGSVERTRPRSPIWRGIVKTWKTHENPNTMQQHNKVCMNEPTYCCCTSLLRCC